MEKKQTMTYTPPVIMEIALENSSILCDSGEGISTTSYEEDTEYNPSIWS